MGHGGSFISQPLTTDTVHADEVLWADGLNCISMLGRHTVHKGMHARHESRLCICWQAFDTPLLLCTTGQPPLA